MERKSVELQQERANFEMEKTIHHHQQQIARLEHQREMEKELYEMRLAVASGK